MKVRHLVCITLVLLGLTYLGYTVAARSAVSVPSPTRTSVAVPGHPMESQDMLALAASSAATGNRKDEAQEHFDRAWDLYFSGKGLVAAAAEMESAVRLARPGQKPFYVGMLAEMYYKSSDKSKAMDLHIKAARTSD